MAVCFVLFAVVTWSLVPFIVDATGAKASPFLFNGGWRLGASFGCVTFLLIRYRGLLCDRGVLLLVAQRIFSWAILLAVVGKFEYALFAWSTRFVDVSVAAILYETWPILMIIFTARLLQGQGRYRRVNAGLFTMLCLGFVGYAFVIVSQVGGFSVTALNFSNGTIYYGLALLVIAALLAGFHNAKLFEWSANLGIRLSNERNRKEQLQSLELFSAISGQAISTFGSTIPSYAIGFTFGEELTYRLLMFSVLGGILASALGDIFWRAANLRTQNLGINALAYATPCFGLTWLFLFSSVDVALPDYLVIGAAAIVTANVLINFEAEIRWGFKALMLGLGTCGAAVYLRGEVFAWLGLDGWQRVAPSVYFEVLALSATIFTLILAFRVARLVTRTRDEDNRTFALFHEMRELSARGLVSPAVCEYILTIDSSEGAKLKVAYDEARRHIAMALRRASTANRDKLVAAQAQLDALTHSRQQGINLAELGALVVFAFINVGLALCLRPETSGLIAFLFDVFTMLFSSVIIFLTLNVFDLQKDRRERILAHSPYEGYALVFQELSASVFEQWISILAGVAIVAAYVGLLGYKWLAWFS